MKALVPHPELVISGRAVAAGLKSKKAIAQKSGIPEPTLYRKLARHSMFETLTWRELVAISKAVGGLSAEDLKEMGLKIRKEET
jgi:hypothetical protein